MAKKKVEESKIETKEEPMDIKSFKLINLDGIGSKTVEKLATIGVTNPIDFIVRGQTLTEYMDKDVLESSLARVYRQLTEAGVLPRTDSLSALLAWRAKKIYFETGSSRLNMMLPKTEYYIDNGVKRSRLLEGGVESQTVTEVYGEEGAGKTQFCLTTMVLAMDKGMNVYFVDCEGTLDIDRITKIAESRGIVPDEAFFSHLIYDLALDTYNINRISHNFVSKVIDNDIKLIIVDGALGQYRLEYSQGRGELKTRQDDIKPFLNGIKQLSFYLNIGLLITNQVMGNPSGFGDVVKPVGGYVVSHLPQRIIMFVKGARNKRIAKLKKSAKSDTYEEEFYITDEGVSDNEKFKPKVVKNVTTGKDEEINRENVPESAMIDKSLLEE